MNVKTDDPHALKSPQLPNHIAIIMDGNGRWAKKRYLPRFFGHKRGLDTLANTVTEIANLGIKNVTVFAFSTENWRRPEDEVSGLMGLILVGITKYLKKLHGEGVKLRFIGDRTSMSERLRVAWREAEDVTEGNTRLLLSIAFNYGGRWDIVSACQRVASLGLAPESISEELISSHLSLSYAPPVDFLIRTGGEHRISNFLIWQAFEARLYFTECLWPDFDLAELQKAVTAFSEAENAAHSKN